MFLIPVNQWDNCFSQYKWWLIVDGLIALHIENIIPTYNMVNQSFQSFGEENIGEFTIANVSYFMEFGWVIIKYWRMTFVSPNSPKFSPAKILCYTVQVYIWKGTKMLISILGGHIIDSIIFPKKHALTNYEELLLSKKWFVHTFTSKAFLVATRRLT